MAKALQLATAKHFCLIIAFCNTAESFAQQIECKQAWLPCMPRLHVN